MLRRPNIFLASELSRTVVDFSKASSAARQVFGFRFMQVSEDWSSWAFKPRSASPAAATKETATAPAAAPAPAPATAAAATAPAPAPALRLELNPKR